ncbi:hypothetical protein [Vibrio splendidus]|uniref:hypothetical protein n=1 Tax=Vibrio splendidus TaxID=29497 RepID=UPI0015E7CF64
MKKLRKTHVKTYFKAISELLEILRLRDCLVTIDASGMPKVIAEKIVTQKKGHGRFNSPRRR